MLLREGDGQAREGSPSHMTIVLHSGFIRIDAWGFHV